jgi:hypothetical protein
MSIAMSSYSPVSRKGGDLTIVPLGLIGIVLREALQ